jgi:hypothetical protein
MTFVTEGYIHIAQRPAVNGDRATAMMSQSILADVALTMTFETSANLQPLFFWVGSITNGSKHQRKGVDINQPLTRSARLRDFARHETPTFMTRDSYIHDRASSPWKAVDACRI